jgi:hypothetical protein
MAPLKRERIIKIKWGSFSYYIGKKGGLPTIK